VLDGPQRTLYLTVWVSADVPTHYMTKTEKADDFFAKHAGEKLSPPIGAHRVSQLGEWGSRQVNVYGDDWWGWHFSHHVIFPSNLSKPTFDNSRYDPCYKSDTPRERQPYELDQKRARHFHRRPRLGGRGRPGQRKLQGVDQRGGGLYRLSIQLTRSVKAPGFSTLDPDMYA
jgi:hypothetical protein